MAQDSGDDLYSGWQHALEVFLKKHTMVQHQHQCYPRASREAPAGIQAGKGGWDMVYTTYLCEQRGCFH